MGCISNAKVFIEYSFTPYVAFELDIKFVNSYICATALLNEKLVRQLVTLFIEFWDALIRSLSS